MREQYQRYITPVSFPVLLDLRDRWSSALEGTLIGLYVHGSLVMGDFAPDRSDLDLLAVLTTDPDERLLEVLAGLHADLDPSWAGRIEVEYVSASLLDEAASGHFAAGRTIARISPGEPLHLLPATTHRVVTWASVHDNGVSLLGPPALPSYDAALVRSALVDHVRDWPVWVIGMVGAPGGQSYAVLTMCRAVQRLRFGRQLSKRQAADRTLAVYPAWAGLIEWARDWWYADGQDSDVGRPDEVRQFVVALADELVEDSV